jgi:hypothetical protein
VIETSHSQPAVTGSPTKLGFNINRNILKRIKKKIVSEDSKYESIKQKILGGSQSAEQPIT